MINFEDDKFYEDDKFQSTTSGKQMWKTFKNLTNTDKQTLPRAISFGGNTITSLKTISNIANDHFINKIGNVRDKFTINNNIKALKILNKLINKNNNSIKAQIASIEIMENIIKKAKAKNSKGNNIITMGIVKQLCPAILPHLTHLINAIIITEIYPSIHKISSISPFLKRDKLSELINSYHPINKLSTMDIMIEQLFKDQIYDFINDNDIILRDHHGSIDGQLTAKVINDFNDVE